MFGTGVGNTPIIELPHELTGGVCRVHAKLEKFNPYSSIKDWVAWYMIEGAEQRGELVRGKGTVVEATSGNTGIALAGFATARGYRSIIVLPDSASAERISLLHYLGAEIALTPSEEGYVAVIKKAEEIRDSVPGAWFACQHENLDNVAAHYESTGPELWADRKGEIDIFVCGVGTGGTITGIARYLKAKNPAIHVVAVEPERSAVLSGEAGGVHKIYGLNGGFVATTTDRSVIDEVITISGEDAWETTRALNRLRIVVGISSGAAAFVAAKMARIAKNTGKNIATIFPDSGERYISVLTT
ncbi:cysteine synthase family protein [Breoghania sp.]|uniref:PLP-dependent cysteine synthase family protein n=1 Tax=Breoghania sp. TaxID=2065378 RepID=UPI002624202A|nr:cysteine synthase family protein [Breoghania sp.]MDJ0931271.1 cysteine synthase family protein [Breoghania sp.]